MNTAIFETPKLKYRERQICECLVEGDVDKEIALKLNLTHGTIKEYIHHILARFKAKNRTDLAVKFLKGEIS